MSLRMYLRNVSDSQRIEALWEAHCNQMADFGFDRLLYGFTRYRTDTSLGDPEDFVILTNHPREYTDVFLSDSHYFHAPMVQWALQNEGAKSWQHIAEVMRSEGLSPQARAIYEFNQKMNVTAGYTVSFKSVSARSKGAIALTAEPGMSQEDIDAVWEKHGNDITLMNNIVHLKILTLPYNTPSRSLTNRQREALEWVGDGKTTQDIAMLMGLTSATVEKHLRLARENLSVETTAQAVLKAAFANQMFILDL
ncbi:LuxR family transcriptional regulator [Sulfitobacter sp. S190]|uniref:LuxR family transcriptional regulator n=1 Tax=Sulfitobacter sp. S190 TaxID=2867022 RepID=UPI0021A6E0A5|nr:LuxR family transcriptional regulator [Sulfitobacter sp. S190]UWR23951.1 LuxR family transcriptional regulator [Sulfitobacter sp. S190]